MNKRISTNAVTHFGFAHNTISPQNFNLLPRHLVWYYLILFTTIKVLLYWPKVTQLFLMFL